MPDLQAAWLVPLHCASARANCLLREVDPEQVQQFTLMHDQRLWHYLCELWRIAPDLCDDAARSVATLPLVERRSERAECAVGSRISTQSGRRAWF